MKVFVFAALAALLAGANADKFKKYDAAAVKRFDDELRRLGVVLPALTKLDEPMHRPNPTASSAAGDFEGYWKKSQFGRPIATFEGIPYAQSPVGPLRFKVAKPLTSRLKNFKAKRSGSMCAQRGEFSDTSKIYGDEDCLFINVYAPERTQSDKSELLPVMFYVHGGGLIGEAGHFYQCEILMDKDVILVTFNYRLGALGFITTEDAVIPSNIGLKDQVAGLKWVHQNIAAFGGDPNLITVFGESAGGLSTEFLMLSPLTKGLIHRVIAMSGSASALWGVAPPGQMRRNVRKVAQHLNCPVEPSQKLLDCFLTKTTEELMGSASLFPFWGQQCTLPFRPVVEGDIPGAHIPQHPAKLFADGLVNDIPYMAGVTSSEGLFFSASFFENDTLIREFDENFLQCSPEALMLTPNEGNPKVLNALRRAYFTPGPLSRSNLLEITNLYSDVYFFWPFMKSMERREGAKSRSYLYYFDYKGSRSFFPYPGVAHGDDLLYVFNYTAVPFPPPSPTDVLMSMVWTDLFTSFARNGAPSSKFLESQWLPVKSAGTDFEYLHVKSPIDLTMKKNLLPERWTLMNKLFEPGHHRDEL